MRITWTGQPGRMVIEGRTPEAAIYGPRAGLIDRVCGALSDGAHDIAVLTGAKFGAMPKSVARPVAALTLFQR